MSSFSLSSAGWNEFNASTPAQDLAWSEGQVLEFHLLGTIQCNLKHPAGLENPIYGAQKDSPGNKNSMYFCLKSNLVKLQHLRVKSKLGYLWPSSPDSNKTTVLENIQAWVVDPGNKMFFLVNHLQVWYSCWGQFVYVGDKLGAAQGLPLGDAGVVTFTKESLLRWKWLDSDSRL